jgi:hypothetical protein
LDAHSNRGFVSSNKNLSYQNYQIFLTYLSFSLFLFFYFPINLQRRMAKLWLFWLKIQMASMLTGNLWNRLVTLVVCHYRYLELPVAAPPLLLHVHPSIGPYCLTHYLLGGVQSNLALIPLNAQVLRHLDAWAFQTREE